ncbi:MAG: hypothetical protein R6U89_07005 [Dehalococcoidia bacterium]
MPGNILCKYRSYSLLKWFDGNGPDFREDRPARLGWTSRAESYGESLLAGTKEYAQANPE